MSKQEKKSKEQLVKCPKRGWDINKTTGNFAKLIMFLSVVYILSVPREADTYALERDFVSPSATSNDQYIILTNIEDSDPWFETVRVLQNYRDAEVLSFDVNDVWVVKDKLGQHNPRYVAFVLKPLDIHINLVRQILMMSTRLDSDSFSDFSYGFITGATAEDALNFVNNIIRAEQDNIQDLPLRIGGCSATTFNTVYFGDGGCLDYLDSEHNMIYLEEGNPESIDFFFESAHYLEGCKAIDWGNSGDPHMLWLFEEGNRAENIWPYDPALIENPPVQRLGLTSFHIQELNLYPAVVFNGACYSGVPKVVPVDVDIKATFGDTGRIMRMYEMSDDFSFLLSLLKTGITGCFAPVGPNNANRKEEDLYHAFFYPVSLGDIHKMGVNSIVMGFLGNDPNLILFFEGNRTDECETLPSGTYTPAGFRSVQSAELSSSCNRVLFGCPKYDPFRKDAVPELNIIETHLTTIDANNLQLDIQLSKPKTFFPLMDKFHEGNTRVYDFIEIPDDEFYGANVQVTSYSSFYHRFIYAFEKFAGKTILHLEFSLPEECIGYAVLFEASVKVSLDELQKASVGQNWTYDLKAPSFGSASTADIDQDGRLEIVFGTYFNPDSNDACLYALNAEDGSLCWKYPSISSYSRVDTSVTIADINNDGLLEVLFADSFYGVVFCLDGRDGSEIWRYELGNCTDSPPAVGNLDEDGNLEVVVGDFLGNVLAINGEDGSLVWKNDQDIIGRVNSAPTLVDVDGNGRLDVIVATWLGDNKVHALRGSNGAKLWSFQTGESMYHGPAFGDIDEDDDGKPELVFASKDGYLYVINCEDASLVWKRYIGVWPDESLFSPVSIADINNDRHLEIIVPAYNVYAFSHKGDQLWKHRHPYVMIARGVAIADLDGDDNLDVAFGDSFGVLNIIKGIDGSLIYSFDAGYDSGDTNNEFRIDQAPIIEDFDNDGYLDIFFVGGRGYSSPSPENNYGVAYMMRRNGIGEGWPKFGFDLVNSANYPSD